MPKSKSAHVVEVVEPEGGVVNGVEYNPLKKKFRAEVNGMHSLYFDNRRDAQMVHDLAMRNHEFFLLNFPDYLR